VLLLQQVVISVLGPADAQTSHAWVRGWQTAAMPACSVGASSPRVLVLWDIDHTLIETRGVGFAIYQRAFKAATGKELDRLANVSGRTELDIMTQTLRINGVEPTDSAITELSRALIGGYEAARDELSTRGRALPGAKETLALLADDARLYQSVLTGNLKDVARIKLEAFGLGQYLDLEAGAYGEDNHDRAALVHRAQERAQVITGTIFSNSQTVLIGDTPNDIRAGEAAGVQVIGVASGKSTEVELREAGAQRVLVDLAPQRVYSVLSSLME
jgi:phosphoglycolate phosphatase